MSRYAQRFQTNIYDNNNYNDAEDNESLDEDEEDEENLFERKALIASSSGQNDTGSRIRLRQTINKNHTISNEGIALDTIAAGQLELKPFRNGPSPLSSEEYTYYDIQHGDTLQSICLRFACSMEQIKRLNGMMTDQDFYGLRRLKLPVGKLGLLRDALESAASTTSHNDDINNSDLLSTTTKSLDGQLCSQTRTMRHDNLVNSPGGALLARPSATTSQHMIKFRPLISPSYSSDRLNNFSNISDTQQRPTTSANYWTAPGELASNNQGQNLAATTRLGGHQHSQSFSSLQDFQVLENQPTFANNNRKLAAVESKLVGENFIRSELHRDGLIDADDLQAACRENVVRVFEDLDYHVGKAKEAAQTYDERASQLVAGINSVSGGDEDDNFSNFGLRFKRSKVSSLPQLFVCNENFGLNLKKLLAFILIVCLLIPLIYILQRQTHYFDFLLGQQVTQQQTNARSMSTHQNHNTNHQHFHNVN